MLQRAKLFLQESRRELKRVNWPTREETLRLTGVVIAISVAVAVFLGAFDYLFLKGVQAIVGTSELPLEVPSNNEVTPESGPDNVGVEEGVNIEL